MKIKGNVIPTPNKLRAKIGKLRLKSTHIAFRKIKDTEIRMDTLEILNVDKKPMEIVFEKAPPHLKLMAVPSILQSDEKGKIIAIYDASKKKNYGNFVDKVQIVIINDAVKTKGKITVSATIEEDFSYMTEEDLVNAPEIHFPTKIFNFGSIKKSEKTSCEFKFENKGERNLIIRSIKVNHGCSIGKFDKVLKPGESGVIEIVVKATAHSKKYQKTITVISNDPKQSSVHLKISGSIGNQSVTQQSQVFENIPPEKAFALIQDNCEKVDFVILDVRTLEEFSEGHIENAINLDYDSDNFKNILTIFEKNKMYLVYCKVGSKSADTMKLMQELGFKNVHYILDGITGWEEAGFPTVK